MLTSDLFFEYLYVREKMETGTDRYVQVVISMYVDDVREFYFRAPAIVFV